MGNAQLDCSYGIIMESAECFTLFSTAIVGIGCNTVERCAFGQSVGITQRVFEGIICTVDSLIGEFADVFAAQTVPLDGCIQGARTDVPCQANQQIALSAIQAVICFKG